MRFHLGNLTGSRHIELLLTESAVFHACFFSTFQTSRQYVQDDATARVGDACTRNSQSQSSTDSSEGSSAAMRSVTCDALQSLSKAGTADLAADSCSKGDDICAHTYAIDNALQNALGGQQSVSGSGQYHVFLLGASVVQECKAGLSTTPHCGEQTRGFVGTGRTGWVELPDLTQQPASSAAGIADVIAQVARAMSMRDSSEPSAHVSGEGTASPTATQQLPVSPASELTVQFTLAVEDAAEVATWDCELWDEV